MMSTPIEWVCQFLLDNYVPLRMKYYNCGDLVSSANISLIISVSNTLVNDQIPALLITFSSASAVLCV